VGQSSSQPESFQSARVQRVGQQLLAANTQLGLRPQFAVIRVPQLTLAHQGPGRLVISEAMVDQCPADAQLAALLSHELGRMAVENAPTANLPGNEPLPPLQVGPDNALYPTESLQKAELVKLGYNRTRPAHVSSDPNAVARSTLRQAGYAEAELEQVAPLLQQAGHAPGHPSGWRRLLP
jgi:hypothetical protein